MIAAGFALGLVLAPAHAQTLPGTPRPGCPLPAAVVPLFDGTPAAIIAATPAMVTADAPSGSAEVDQSIIEAAVADIVTCINTGDPPSEYAIFTPRYLASQFLDGSGHYQPAFEQELDSPAQLGTTRFELVAVDDVLVREDGRIQVTIELKTGSITYRDTLILAYVDGYWLIDDVAKLDPAP